MSRVVCLAVVIALCATPLAAAQQPLDIPTLQKETTLVLRGEGSVEMKPDFATINVGVSVEAPKAVDAMNQQNAQMNLVIAALKKSGIADRDVKTSNLSLNPAYSYPNNQPPRVRGYNATNTVTIKVRNVDKLGATIDAIVGAGSNTINGIFFGVENDDEPSREARTNAVKDAMAKAEDYARAMGYKVKRIVNVAEPYTRGPEPLGDRVVVTGARLEAGAPTQVEAGEVSIRQFVDVTFELTK
jgi:uncharacterized protein